MAGQKKVDSYRRVLKLHWEELPPIFVTSAEKGTGRDDLLGFIEQVNRDIAQSAAK